MLNLICTQAHAISRAACTKTSAPPTPRGCSSSSIGMPVLECSTDIDAVRLVWWCHRQPAYTAPHSPGERTEKLTAQEVGVLWRCNVASHRRTARRMRPSAIVVCRNFTATQCVVVGRRGGEVTSSSAHISSRELAAPAKTGAC